MLRTDDDHAHKRLTVDRDSFAHRETREARRPTLDAQRDGLYFKTNAKAGCP